MKRKVVFIWTNKKGKQKLITQEVVLDIERDKKEVVSCIEKKDREIHESQRKLDDEQNVVGKLQQNYKGVASPH